MRCFDFGWLLGCLKKMKVIPNSNIYMLIGSAERFTGRQLSVCFVSKPIHIWTLSMKILVIYLVLSYDLVQFDAWIILLLILLQKQTQPEKVTELYHLAITTVLLSSFVFYSLCDQFHISSVSVSSPSTTTYLQEKEDGLVSLTK